MHAPTAPRGSASPWSDLRRGLFFLISLLAFGCDGTTPVDAGGVDAGGRDAGGGMDAAVSRDAGIDAGRLDAGAGDAGTLDAGALDAGRDAGTGVDASVALDAGMDASVGVDSGIVTAACMAPTAFTCFTVAVVGNTCSETDESFSSCSNPGAPEAWYQITVPPGRCCSVSFDVGSNPVITGGDGDPCSSPTGCGTFARYDWVGGTTGVVKWFAIESGTTPCGTYTFTVNESACP